MNNLSKSLITMLSIALLIFAAVCGGGGSGSNAGGTGGGGGVVNGLRSVSAGYTHCIAIYNGNMYVWGYNDYYQLGLETPEGYLDKSKMLDDICNNKFGCDNDEKGYNVTWETASAGGFHSLAIGDYYDTELHNDLHNIFWGWGQSCWGQLPQPWDDFNYGYYPVIYSQSQEFIAVSAGDLHSAAITKEQKIIMKGCNANYRNGWCYDEECEDDDQWLTNDNINRDWIFVSAGYSHTMAIKSDGSLWGWGDNDYNQIGIINADPTVDEYWMLQRVGEDHKWESVSAGYYQTAAITTNGELYAWGGVGIGFAYLGDGTRVGKETPVRIGTDSDWKMVSVGHEHTVAIKNDGRLFVWGSNGHGQLGTGVDNVNHYETSPVEMKPGTRWILADAGYDCTIAMTEMGHVWGWGDNSYYQIADEASGIIYSNVPVKIELNSGGATTPGY